MREGGSKLVSGWVGGWVAMTPEEDTVAEVPRTPHVPTDG